MSLFNRILATKTIIDTTTQVMGDNAQTQDVGRASSSKHYRDLSDEDYEARRKAERKSQKLEEDNKKLLKDKDELRKVAITMAADRQAILNTIKYLGAKWGQPIQDEEIENLKDSEYRRISKDAKEVEKLNEFVDRQLPQTGKKSAALK